MFGDIPITNIKLGDLQVNKIMLGDQLVWAYSPAPTAFKPTDIPNCVLWLDAADTTSVQHTSSAVDQWNDKSGAGNHATKTDDATRPSTNTRTYNGKNVINFTPVNQHLNLNHQPILDAIQSEHTVIVVGVSDIISQAGTFLGGRLAAGQDRYFIRQQNTLRFWTLGNASIMFVTNGTSPFIAASARTAANQMTYFYNNANIKNDNANTFTGLANFTIGNMSPIGGGNDLDGGVFEIIIYNRRLTDTEITEVKQYLSLKWGIFLATDTSTIFLSTGQSNNVSFAGISTIPAVGEPNPRIFQMLRSGAGSDDQTIAMATQPLQHHPSSDVGTSLAYQFAQNWLAANPDKKIVIIPAAKGSTGFTTNNWKVGDDLYNDAVLRANTAMSMGTGTKTFGGILHHHGEQDISMTQTAFATELDAMATGFRSDITGASNAPFICGDFVPDWNIPASNAVRAALADTPNRLPNSAFVQSTGLTHNGDGIHFGGVDQLELGNRYWTAYQNLL